MQLNVFKSHTLIVRSSLALNSILLCDTKLQILFIIFGGKERRSKHIEKGSTCVSLWPARV